MTPLERLTQYVGDWDETLGRSWYAHNEAVEALAALKEELMKVELVNAEVLTVGPDETLIIKVAKGMLADPEEVKFLHEAIEAAGISRHRYFLVEGEIEFAKVKRWGPDHPSYDEMGQ
jgi:hypothetical protein